MYKNAVSKEVVRLERRPGGAKFDELRELVAGARGRQVYESGDSDAGIWSSVQPVNENIANSASEPAYR